MSGRYLGPIGQDREGPPEKTALLINRARTLAGTALDLLHKGSGQQHLREVQADGSTIHVYVQKFRNLAPVVRCWVEATKTPSALTPEKAAPTYYLLCTVWRPTGFTLTPRSATAPYGYGPPRRDFGTGARINAPFGTLLNSVAEECLNQVIINRQRENNYLDTPSALKTFVLGLKENQRLFDRADLVVNSQGWYWPWRVGYEPADTSFWSQTMPPDDGRWVDWPGANRINSKTAIWTPTSARQDQARVPLWTEPETSEWRCHWPEETLYDNAALEVVYQRTNTERLAAGETRVIRPLRGDPSPARTVVTEMQRAKLMAHTSDDFRPGYRTTGERIMGSVSAVMAAENLQISATGGINETAGSAAFDAWLASPGHAANILSEDWSFIPHGTTMDVVGGVPVETIGTNYAWAQIFLSRHKWVSGGLWNNATPYGLVGSRSQTSFLPIEPASIEYPYDQLAITHLGRLHVNMTLYDRCLDVYNWYPMLSWHEVASLFIVTAPRILGATIFACPQRGLCFRMVAVIREPRLPLVYDDGLAVLSHVVHVYEAPLGSSSNGWVLTHSQTAEELSPNTNAESALSRSFYSVTFTPDGLSGVFTVTYRHSRATEDYAPFLFHSDIAVSADGKLSILRQYQPPSEPRLPLTGLSGWNGNPSYDAQANLFPHYVGNEMHYVNYRMEATAVETTNHPACSYNITMTAGGRTIQQATLSSSTDTSFTAHIKVLCYWDPRTGDYAAAELDIEKSAGGGINNRGTTQLRLAVNGEAVKTYPTSTTATVNGTTILRDGDQGIPFFTTYSAFSGATSTWMRLLANPGFFDPMSQLFGNFSFYDATKPCPPMAWPPASPNNGGNHGYLHMKCEMVRVGDDLFGEIIFHDYANICAEESPFDCVLIAPDVAALSNLIGIGPLTRISPLGAL